MRAKHNSRTWIHRGIGALLLAIGGCGGNQVPDADAPYLDPGIAKAKATLVQEPMRVDELRREITTPHGQVIVVRQGNILQYRRGQHFFQEIVP